MTAYLANPEAWQESWNRQQEGYLPDREHRFATMLDAVDAATGGAPPKLLDLAGGTGTITLRALARFGGNEAGVRTEATVLDQDPVLLAIAAASLGNRARIVSADLSSPRWTDQVGTGFDAVLTATALHWLEADRVRDLYAEIRTVLRPGGIFVNADHMPDDDLGEFGKQLISRADARREARYAAGAVLSWRDWWKHVATDDFLRPLLTERERIYPTEAHTAEWTPPAAWHIAALRDAGFEAAGLLWRAGSDSAVLAVA
jgi:SAM-dependent methyltransferase